MTSWAIRESRWFLTNYILMLAVYLSMLLIWMVVALAAGWFQPVIADSSLLDFAVGFGLFTLVFAPVVVGTPLLAAGLAVWRVGRRITGQSRLTVYGLAAVVVGFVALRVPDAVAFNILVFVALPALAYATIVREPTPGSFGSFAA
jgi:hypothetical protein